MTAPSQLPDGSAGSIDPAATRLTWPATVASLGGLILLCVLWEVWLAPFKSGSFLLSLKALPLILPLLGALRRSVYTLQWSSMLIWLYFIEGVVRGFRNPDRMTSMLAWLEVALVVLFFISALLFLRPYKQAAKLAAKQGANLTARQSAQDTANGGPNQAPGLAAKPPSNMNPDHQQQGPS